MDKDELFELQADIDIAMASECCAKQDEAAKKGESFVCTCDDPFKWSEEKVLEWHKERDNE